MPFRKISPDEERLLDHLVKLSGKKMPADWKQQLMVEPMDDGNMGSLVLHPLGKIDNKREFGSTLSEYGFKDSDRADVVASLNADQQGMIFELDIWKTTFEPLKKIPDNFH